MSTRPMGIQKVGRQREVAHEAKRCTGACCEHELQREKNPPRKPIECLYQLIMILKAKNGARASDVNIGVMDNGLTNASAE